MDLVIDCANEIGPFEHFWRSTGFSPADLLLTKDMQQQMAYAGSLPHGGITYARVHFLLELVKGEHLLSEMPSYDWRLLDMALDVLMRNNLVPIFEVMGNPSGAFSDFNDARQLHAWKRMVGALARHLIERYGWEHVSQWYFETWNEPDGGWWPQWPHDEQSFCNYYDASSEGLRAVSSRLIFGGPGTCRTLSSLFKAVMRHCDTGKNYFTGETGVRLDFISIHEKGARATQEDIDPNTLALVGREAQIVEYLRANHPRLAQTPFMNNECDPQVGWWHTHTWHGRPYYAAIMAKIVNQHIRVLLDEMRVPFTILSNDHGFVGKWGNRTLMARFGLTHDEDNGQSHHTSRAAAIQGQVVTPPFDMIKKPGLNVMALLALLGDRRLAVGGAGDARDDAGVIATQRDGAQVAVLVYNSRDRIMSSGTTAVHVVLEHLPFKEAMLAHYRIDERHGDPFTVWEAAGAPDFPSAAVFQQMRNRQELELLEEPRVVQSDDGKIELRFDLPLPAVSLIVLSVKPDRPPGQVQGVRLETYRGLNDQDETLVCWRGLPDRTLRTYEVLCATSPDGPFVRVNQPDVIGTAFMHVPDPASGQRYYRVRSVDYWERYGVESETVSL
jgi:L-iduronidase